MRRPFRTGLVAGLLALTLTGAACGSGETQKPTKSEGAVSQTTAPATPETSAPAAGVAPTPAGAPAAAPVTTATAPKAAAPKTAAAPKPAPKATTTTTTAKKADPVTLRLGYFPNVTHASAIAGVEKGFFADKLGPGVNFKTSIFNAGGAATEALFSGAIDATFIGPSPSVNAFAKSKGEAIRIIAGATSGGAALVVKPNINSAADLKGQKVATPQLGNTQDVALRAWLLGQGLKTDTQGGGDVKIVPQENGQTLETFKTNQIAGAWVPEPWATRLVQEGGGKVLVDERTLWPGGQFVTTNLIVSTSFLKAHPDVVERLLQGHMAATDYVNQNTAEAQEVVNAGIAKVTGQAMKLEVIRASWSSMAFTFDPLAATLHKGADDAKSVGLLAKDTNIDGIYDLSILNKLLSAAGKPPVANR
jgi:NitT/TauT family transport system substrate-binding protein